MPKFVIRNFADDDGRVYCLDIMTDAVGKLPPRKAASRPSFNDFLMNGKVVSFEDQLEKIETQAAPILARIVRTRSTAGLNDDQRRRVARFIAAQSFRTEAFYIGLEFGSSRQQFGAVFTELWRSAFFWYRMRSNVASGWS